jgi:hypothetical protein
MPINRILCRAGDRLRSSGAAGHLRGGVRRASRYRGALVIALWQAPVGPVANPDGSLGFMFGGGLDHVLSFNCDGDVVDRQRSEYTFAAVEADYDITPGVRLEGVGGLMKGARDWDVEAGGVGAYGGARIRFESRKAAIGIGVARSPELSLGDMVFASVYARAGDAEGMHVRADLKPMHALMPQQFGRVGLGWNATQRNRPSGFLGVAALGSSDALGLAGEYTLPIGSRGAVRGIGHYGIREGDQFYGVALGGQVRLP